MPINEMPRRITVFLSAPPGDGLRAAREHFHEYIKPVLVAGALDWEVVEGRREGEVRAGLAEKIRKMREKNVEKHSAPEEEKDEGISVERLRQGAGIRDWEGIRGDLVLGRHTWKEYVRGLHEGWLGPLESPKIPEEPPLDASLADMIPASSGMEGDQSSPDSPLSQDLPLPQDQASDGKKPPDQPPEPKKPSGPVPAYIASDAYAGSPLPASFPEQLGPSVDLPFPHLLGFLNTPIRIYRFLNRRHLADQTGRSVAAIVLASSYRPYRSSTEFASAADPDENSPTTDTGTVVESQRQWEQQNVQLQEEAEWHKIAWKPDETRQEREWIDKMVIDARIGEKMRAFELPEQELQRARRIEEEEEEESQSREGPGWFARARKWAGMEPDTEKKGWQMGLEGDQED